MRTEPVPRCPICGGGGPVLYAGLRDRVFGAPGRWNFRRCQSCRSLWLDPRPAAEDRLLAYSAYFTHDPCAEPTDPGSFRVAFAREVRRWRDAGTAVYVARRFGYPLRDRSWRARAVAQLIRVWAGRRLDAESSVMRLQWRRDGRVLDVGAGNGELLARLRDFGWTVRGVDFDPDAARAAASRGIQVDLGDPRSLEHPTESFDAVVLSHVIEHVEEPGAVLAEGWRVLAPGGELVVVTPNADSVLHRRFGSDWQPLETPRHLQVFTPSSLSWLAEQAGLTSLRTMTTAHSANGIARAAWKFRREGRWDMRSRPSLLERVLMEAVQQCEAVAIRRRPDAGEELVLTAVKD
jgi:SAM-dependent methyltransferase